MNFLVPNYSCLQNPWLGDTTAPRSPFSLSSTKFVDPPPRTKFLGTPLVLFNGLLDLSLSCGVSRQIIRQIKCWMENQHLVLCRGPCSTHRQAGELISGLDLAKRARLLSSNTTQSSVVIGLLTGHNTVRRHLYIMGLSNNPICRKCGTVEETSVHIYCVSVRPWLHSDMGSFFLDPEDIRGHLELW